MAAPRHALQRKLLEGLRYLLKEEFKLNQPQASDGWLTQDALWLVSKRVSDKLRAHLLSQGIEGIPSNNTAVFNVLQDHGIALPTADGKAIWKATITSDAGWSHSVTFLSLSPALIWDSGGRPTPFTGTVQVEQDSSSEADPPPTKATMQTPLAISSSSSLPNPHLTLGAVEKTGAADGVDDLLALFSTAGAQPTAGNEAEDPDDPPVLPAAVIPTLPVAAVALTPKAEYQTADPEAPSGEHFMQWLRQSVSGRRVVINDAKVWCIPWQIRPTW